MPAAGYEISYLEVSGLSRHEPAARRARGSPGSGGRCRGAAAAGERGADAVLGGGGYVAGPVGLAAALLPMPLVLSEADSHLGFANRHAGAVRAAGLPRVPDRGPRRRALPRDRAAGAARDPRSRPGRRARGARHRAAGACVLDVRRQPRRPLDQRCGARGVRPRGEPRRCCTSPAGATTPSWPRG